MSPSTSINRASRIAIVLAVLVTALAFAVGNAAASPGEPALNGFTVTPSSTQAGAHGDLNVHLGLASSTYTPTGPVTGDGTAPQPDEQLKSATIALPPGMLGNPTSFPTCSDEQINVDASGCPSPSQVGVMSLRVGQLSCENPNDSCPVPDPSWLAQSPIFNTTPGPGQVARLVVPFVDGEVSVHLDIAIRDDSDYGLTATVSNIPATLPLLAVDVDLWGQPSATTHDSLRLSCWNFGVNAFFPGCSSVPQAGTDTFLVNPTNDCSAALSASASATFYGDSRTYGRSAQMGPFTGCSSLPFSPSLSLSPDATSLGQPAGYDVSLSVPQPAPDDLSGTTPSLRDATVTLPAGVALSPGVADGLGACSDAQFAAGSRTPVSCPLSSQIGSVTIHSPLLAQSLTGHAYIGTPLSTDPASGQMYRLLLDAVGQGVDVKLVGSVAADPATGRLTATFRQNPQVPFDSLQLSLKGGPRAPLTNPATCGTATSSWAISSYANPTAPVTGSSSFPVAGDCAAADRFAPSLSAGVADARAGASSPFSFTLTRPDGQQDIGSVSKVVLPPGLLASIASVTPCTTVAACPTAARVGSATILAGAGAAPFSLAGQPVYLTGPYRGAPYGLAVVVHALAGPFDLGTVIVRQALAIDPVDAHVTIDSDPLPTMLGGVPLHIRSVSLNIDRAGFMRSPTSCTARRLTASVTGSPLGVPASVPAGATAGFSAQAGRTVSLSTPFAVDRCGALRFAPRLGITLSGRNATRTGGHPRLDATLTQAAGQANLKAAKVALPLSLALDPDNSQHVCSVAAAARIACPARTIVGRATATTRILPHPLSGRVYLVQGIRYDKRHRAHKTLPTLLVALRGKDNVAIDLTAKTSVDGDQQLVTTFPTIPDAPISRFGLRIYGGKRGILVVTGSKQSLCSGRQLGGALESGQNGRSHSALLRYRTSGCRKG